MISSHLGRLKKRLSSIADERTERLDVLRMGVESAWAELRTALETAMSPEPMRASEPAPDGQPAPSTS